MISEGGSEPFDAGGASVNSRPGVNRTEALRERMFGSAVAALEIYTVYLGERLGLYRALADGGPGPPAPLARPPRPAQRDSRRGPPPTGPDGVCGGR